MSRRRLRALRPVTAVLLGAAMITTGGPPVLAAASAPAVQASRCGPMDVAFVVDDTGSMGGALTNLKAGISSSIIPQIASLSGGDYQLGLVTFKDNVTVLDDLAPGNQASVTAHVNALVASGGVGEPEASDEGLNTAVNRLPAGPPRPQTGSFNGVWRTNAMKIAVVLTDARPGGFDDTYTAADSANAHTRATQAVTNGIRLSSVYVHTSTAYDSTIIPVMQDYATTTGGQYTVTAQDGSGTSTAIQQILDSCTKRTDVYMADQSPADVGIEPDTAASSVYWSPDIKVCPTPADCAPGGNPVVGVTNYIRVTLHNPGPYGSGTSLGSLHLYRTPLSGATTWNPATGGDWVPINTVSLSVPPGTTTAVVPWTAVPGPGHFCLLARWVSGTDPMGFAEGPNTLTNTRNNNNIAWHNVDTVRLTPGSSDTRPFTLGNPLDGPLVSDLTFTPVTEPFVGPNRLIVDLGATLAQRWKQAGQPGVGVRAVGETQVEITDPRTAQIQGLVVNRGERFEINLTFTAGQTTAGASTLNVAQLSKGVDYGGVEYLPIVG
jgi:hypothetical protein